MTTETTNYLREAADDAADTVRNFADEILEQLLDDGKASDDLLNDYPDGDPGTMKATSISGTA